MFSGFNYDSLICNPFGNKYKGVRSRIWAGHQYDNEKGLWRQRGGNRAATAAHSPVDRQRFPKIRTLDDEDNGEFGQYVPKSR